MTRPLGKRQIDVLTLICCPGRALVVPDKITDSLVARGLCEAMTETGSFVHITPAGLRAVADLADAGKVRLAPDIGADR